MTSILKVWKELKDWEKALFIITTIFMFVYLPIIIFLPFYVGDIVMMLTIGAMVVLMVSLRFSKIDNLVISLAIISIWLGALMIISQIYLITYEPGTVTITPLLMSLVLNIITYIFLGISLISYLIISIYKVRD